MTTLAQLRTQAKARFRDTANAIYDDTYWNNTFDAGYMHIVQSSPYWPFLVSRATISYTSGDNSSALPTNLRTIDAVYNATDDLPMAEITGRKTYRELWPDTVSTGTPIHYRRQGSELEIYPVPAAATSVVVDYTVRPSTLSADGDEPVFPGEFHKLLIEWALAHAYLDDGNLDQYGIHMQLFERQLEQMKFVLLTPTGDSYPQINDSFY